MTTPELPALPNQPRAYRIDGCIYVDSETFIEFDNARKTRESILVAEIERLRALWMAAEERAAHAEEAALSHAEKIERLRAHASALAEVMAMIHGDGGHYLAKHGPTKAAEDAAKKHAKLCAEAGAMRAELRSALFNVDTSGDIGPHSWAYVELANVARDLVDASRGAK